MRQDRFTELRGYNPSTHPCPSGDGAVETSSWHEATAYCNARSASEGRAPCYACAGSGSVGSCVEGADYAGTAIHEYPGFRLPTEVEWAGAYRLETEPAYYNGRSNQSVGCATCATCAHEAAAGDIAWCCDKAGSGTHPVGQKEANGDGLLSSVGFRYARGPSLRDGSSYIQFLAVQASMRRRVPGATTGFL